MAVRAGVRPRLRGRRCARRARKCGSGGTRRASSTRTANGPTRRLRQPRAHGPCARPAAGESRRVRRRARRQRPSPERRSRPDPQRERGGSTPLHDLSRGADHRIRQDHAPAAQGLRRRITLSRGRGRRARCICRDADHARRPGAVTAFAHGPLRAADPQSPGEVRGSTVLRSPLAPACFPLLAPACSLSGRSTATMAPSSMCGSGTRQRAESFPCERATTRAHAACAVASAACAVAIRWLPMPDPRGGASVATGVQGRRVPSVYGRQLRCDRPQAVGPPRA